MTGIPLYNFPAFDAVAAEWRRYGHLVETPPDITRRYWFGRRCVDFDPATDVVAHGSVALCDLFALDASAVCRADALVLLPGWEKSRGAQIEVALARLLGKPCYDAETRGLIHVEAAITFSATAHD